MQTNKRCKLESLRARKTSSFVFYVTMFSSPTNQGIEFNYKPYKQVSTSFKDPCLPNKVELPPVYCYRTQGKVSRPYAKSPLTSKVSKNLKLFWLQTKCQSCRNMQMPMDIKSPKISKFIELQNQKQGLKVSLNAHTHES